MDQLEQLAALQARLASAETERDTWRGTGMQENYLEAYSRVEALSLQLDGMRSHAITEPGIADAKERLMSELAIRFDGRQYRYRDYRYDRLDDAVAYARLELERGQE